MLVSLDIAYLDARLGPIKFFILSLPWEHLCSKKLRREMPETTKNRRTTIFSCTMVVWSTLLVHIDVLVWLTVCVAGAPAM